MNSYEVLADRYDRLTTDVDYDRWADYLEWQFQRSGGSVRSVADLACGTGSLLFRLAQRGYVMTGVDLSEDMLAVAADKCAQLDEPPLLLHQNMAALTLLEPVDAVVCCLDSLNYVTRPRQVQRTFERVWQALAPGGLFVFDIRSPEMLRSMDGQICLDETEDTYCVWRGEYSPKRRVLSYYMDLFCLREDGTWERGEELHEEYAYEADELGEWLRQAGFSGIKRYGDLKRRPPKPDEERIFFAARKD